MVKPKPKSRKPLLLIGWGLVVLGVVGVIVASVVFFRIDSAPKPPDSTIGPSATQPTAPEIDSYSVAPDLPKYITIPVIDVPKSRVFALGQDHDQILSPANIYDAGWYNASSKPGQHGAMFIYGHASNWQAEGLFYNLKDLKPGDRVTITRGDNKQYTYRVNSAKTYPQDKVDMQQILSPIDPAKPGLNLMTCAGHPLDATGQFSERLVVFTSLEEIKP